MDGTTLALNSDQIGKIGIGAIVAVVVIGLLLGMIISAIVGRLIILVIVVGLGVYIWQQRASIEDHVKDCNLNMSFFGYHVDAPADVVQQCRNLHPKD
jgi:hypothetical protein